MDWASDFCTPADSDAESWDVSTTFLGITGQTVGFLVKTLATDAPRADADATAASVAGADAGLDHDRLVRMCKDKLLATCTMDGMLRAVRSRLAVTNPQELQTCKLAYERHASSKPSLAAFLLKRMHEHEARGQSLRCAVSTFSGIYESVRDNLDGTEVSVCVGGGRPMCRLGCDVWIAWHYFPLAPVALSSQADLRG